MCSPSWHYATNGAKTHLSLSALHLTTESYSAYISLSSTFGSSATSKRFVAALRAAIKHTIESAAEPPL